MRAIRVFGDVLRPLLRRPTFTCSSHTLKAVPSSDVPTSTHSTLLEHRSLVRVRGQDANTFLQGLVTADVSNFEEQQSLYSMLLNVQGRVLYDIILYNTGDNTILLECDINATTDVIKHLKKYALRSKVEISPMNSDLSVWSLFPGQATETTPTSTSTSTSPQYFPDPRLRTFGTRLIGRPDSPADSIKTLTQASLSDYHHHRLKMGVAEGVEEIPIGACFPLEYNLDYLDGVSFSKGCYLGQELTARTHHTGVVRKRVMPISLKDSSCSTVEIPLGTQITSSSGKSAGKLVCLHGVVGLALLRIQEASKEGLFMESTEGKRVDLITHKPEWWPPPSD